MFFFFFDEVEAFLKDSLDASKNESYEKEKSFGNDIIVDYFLPYGCAKWNYPPNSIIEVVKSLKSGTVYRAKRTVTALRQGGCDIKAYYIFCKETPCPEHLPLRSQREPSVIHVVDFNTICVRKKPIFEQDDFWQDRQDRIKLKAKSDFDKGRNTLFLGAGLSKSCELPDWDKLLESLLDSLREDGFLSVNDNDACKNDSQNSPLIKARYIKQFYTAAQRSCVSDIRKILYNNDIKEGQLLKSVVSLIKTTKVDAVISYNYDDLLEKALQLEGIPFTPIDKSNRPHLGTLPILHTHGFIPIEGDDDYERNVILSEDEYHDLYRNTYHWANVEQLHALTQTTCYFIGLSMRDPSLRRLLDNASERGSGVPAHYAFLKRDAFKQPSKAEAVFSDMGVNVIWYKDYNEFPLLVEELIN